jgi:hypothetical protein
MADAGENSKPSPRVAALVEKAKEKALYSTYGNGESKKPLLAADVPEALAHIKANRDYTSYFLLLLLRQDYPDSYGKIPKKDKAAVLCSALKNATSLNDWGHLGGGAAYDYNSAKALTEIGKDAIEFLLPLLDDKADALHWGSKAATISFASKYRRCDFAYRYTLLILERQPEFHRDLADRDKDIAELKREVKK